MNAGTERLDKWLWFARFVKTRGLAQKLIERGQVSVNGTVAGKAGHAVRIGDRLVIVLGPVKRSVTVRGLGERRGPAEEARTLYDEPKAAERLSAEEAALPLYLPG